MENPTLHNRAALLQAVAAGQSCKRVATTYGLATSVVSQRVRDLASDLQRIVGVIGVEEDESPTARLIRDHRDAYLEALSHYVPAAALPHTPDMPSEERLQACLARIRRRSRSPLRDEALLLLLFSAAAKPLEIASLEVGDYLDAAGTIRASSFPRPARADYPSSRALSFSCPRTRQAVDAYLAERVERGWGTHAPPTYRGLDPASRLFLSRTGQPMRLALLAGGRYLLCKEIHGIYRRLFAYGGLQGLHASGVRRMAATQMRANGATRREIGAALGIGSLAVHRLLLPAPAWNKGDGQRPPHTTRMPAMAPP